jgi:hypothetical protein
VGEPTECDLYYSHGNKQDSYRSMPRHEFCSPDAS